MSAGLIAVLAALAAALAGGAIWRQANGKMRAPRAARRGGSPSGHRAADTLKVSVGQKVRTGLNSHRNHQGVAATPSDGPIAAGRVTSEPITAHQIGQDLGERATLLQFSSAFCAPCRATRRILAEVAGMTDGVTHVEIDAESRLDLVRQLNVLRTPTVLVLDSAGRVVRRASGQPRKPDVIAAIGTAVGLGGSQPNAYILDRETR